MKCEFSLFIFLFLIHFTFCQDENETDGVIKKIANAFHHLQMVFHREDLPPFEQPNGIEPFPPKQRKLIEQRSLADYCIDAKPGTQIQLGFCSPLFVVCESSTSIRFENCPTGKVFSNDECHPATTQSSCFEVSSNQLNHATEKLAQATSFCRVHSSPGFVHLAAVPNECSRQALICSTNGQPFAIACPRDFVLNENDLTCYEAHHHCRFTEKSMLQPVKTALERLYCFQHGNEDEPSSSIPSQFSDQLRSNDISIAKSGMRCKDWFVTCHHPNKEFVFCGQDSMFVKEQGACRSTRPTDKCPVIFNCRDFEWRIIPFGKCRPEFIYCRGLIPVQFQCRPDYVLFNGKCVLKKSIHEECLAAGGGNRPESSECELGTNKSDNANCTRFFKCEEDMNSVRRWRHYECPEGEGYDPHAQDCSHHYKCDAECQEGQSFLINCYEYFQCRNKQFQAGVCPSKSRYSVDEHRCIFDPGCKHREDKHTDEQPTEECHENGFIKSKDCISYGMCKQNIIHWKPCQLLNGHYHDQCPGCNNSHQAAGNSSQNGQQQPKNPDAESNFAPTECTDGAVVLSRNECKRLMRCYAGNWFMVECPNGKFFSLQTQACTAETCESSGVYLPPSGTPDQVPDYKLSVEKPWCNDSSCCTSTSSKLPIHADCQKYKECDTSTGRYVERLCSYNEHFSGKEQKCVEGRDCEAYSNDTKESKEGKEEYLDISCEVGQMRSMKKCGHFRLCVGSKWSAGQCKNDMAFVDGKCSKTKSCADLKGSGSKDGEEYGGVCRDNESKPHPYSCNKYLVCDHGIFVERICSYGALFDPKNQRCDSSYECEYKNQPKCYEGQVKSSKQNCHAYLFCLEGHYVEETCPDHQVYNDQIKACISGQCEYNEEEKEEKKKYEEESTQATVEEGGNKKKSHSKEEYDDGAPESVPCKEFPGAAGFRRDRHKCDRFWQCANGDWVPKTCTSGTVFNTHIGVCDWPRNVPGCENY